MTRTRGFTMPSARWLVLAGIPLAFIGCQNEGRSDGPAPGSTAMAPGAASMQPSAARLDDATKTTMLLRQIHASNMDEIDMSKLALERAQNPEVKKFANEMVTDHTNADQKVMDVAKRANLDLNAAPHDPVVQAMQSASEDSKRSLRALSGSQFEVGYVAPQVQLHTVALRLVEEAQKTSSGDTKKVLDEIRPTVESHLDHSKSLMRGLVFSPIAVGGGPMGGGSMGGEGAPMGSVQAGKGDAGHREKEKPKPNP